MAQELFYEVKNGKVLIYDTGGFSLPDEPHLRYLTQARIAAGETSDLEGVLRKTIAERMERVPRRIKHRDRATFGFVAVPINRDHRPTELPTISGHYANPHYQNPGERKI